MPTQGAYTYADSPAIDSTRKISSGAYATDDKASDANTGSAIRLGSSVCPSESLRKGRPTSIRLAAVVNFDTLGSIREPGTTRVHGAARGR
ncbi:hypothetical protein Ntsu_27970 [Nocardia sp. IFM 10818]